MTWFHSLTNSWGLDQFYLNQFRWSAYFILYKSHFLYTFISLVLKKYFICGKRDIVKLIMISIVTIRRPLDIDLCRPQPKLFNVIFPAATTLDKFVLWIIKLYNKIGILSFNNKCIECLLCSNRAHVI